MHPGINATHHSNAVVDTCSIDSQNGTSGDKRITFVGSIPINGSGLVLSVGYSVQHKQQHMPMPQRAKPEGHAAATFFVTTITLLNTTTTSATLSDSHICVHVR